MRTNIVLNDRLVAKAKEATGLRTKRAVVEEGLRTLVRLHQQAKIKSLRGKLHWSGDLNSMRKARFAR